DVAPFVDAELNRRFAGRAQRRAEDPDGLRAAWAALERTWAVTLDRVAAMPSGCRDVSVDGEWSFTQTLRHLVLATDMWLGRGIMELEQPFHPLGLRGGSDGGFDMSVFTTDRGASPPRSYVVAFFSLTTVVGPFHEVHMSPTRVYLFFRIP
ncbi:MAG TPA: DinB family protein, partial [Candidatus Limnocylindrales bacterium]|nr:DinB family protein [Candidatus Limnocylindrales bacterium]